MEKLMKRSAAFLCLIAALGAAAVSLFVKPARVKNGNREEYIYSPGKKKKNSAGIVIVTNMKPSKAVKKSVKNYIKNII